MCRLELIGTTGTTAAKAITVCLCFVLWRSRRTIFYSRCRSNLIPPSNNDNSPVAEPSAGLDLDQVRSCNQARSRRSTPVWQLPGTHTPTHPCFLPGHWPSCPFLLFLKCCAMFAKQRRRDRQTLFVSLCPFLFQFRPDQLALIQTLFPSLPVPSVVKLMLHRDKKELCLALSLSLASLRSLFQFFRRM